MTIRKDVAAGALVALLGLAFIIMSFSYEMGAPNNLGPGYFPALLGGVMLIAGLAILVPGLKAPTETIDIAWRGIAFVGAGMAGFIAGMQHLGFIPACLIAGFLSSLAHAENRYRDAALIAVILTVLVVLIFIVILKQPRPLIRGLL